jgi:hypothetical protein
MRADVHEFLPDSVRRTPSSTGFVDIQPVLLQHADLQGNLPDIMPYRRLPVHPRPAGKMDAEAALQKARAMKAVAVGSQAKE